jgi:uncharacterized protein YcfJ
MFYGAGEYDLTTIQATTCSSPYASTQPLPSKRRTRSRTSCVSRPTTQGAAVRGAARGALAGVAIGAIAGDAGTGAAIGAAAGAIGGRRHRRHAEAHAAQQGAAQAEAQNQQAVETFKKAVAVCLEGRGYTAQ